MATGSWLLAISRYTTTHVVAGFVFFFASAARHRPAAGELDGCRRILAPNLANVTCPRGEIASSFRIEESLLSCATLETDLSHPVCYLPGTLSGLRSRSCLRDRVPTKQAFFGGGFFLCFFCEWRLNEPLPTATSSINKQNIPVSVFVV
ncbi:hypothetical protein LX32DRAFT_250644 [Colletotrichum zoysiae]|uniref:Uncharacterized protein n=1 Tax=Colletotrichum zoysiae TaxID=1216348 RepID=A0AAD9H3L9_9PEZI|nr:hypothetical protein LX32DRAFT_250644 [Colletotrichum zoysiae]